MNNLGFPRAQKGRHVQDGIRVYPPFANDLRLAFVGSEKLCLWVVCGLELWSSMEIYHEIKDLKSYS